jgi:hypothetical protein
MAGHLLDGGEDDPIDFSEDIERSWRVYMTNFQNEVYPMFKQYGLNIGDALIVWELNRMKNAINRLVDKDEDGT